jgi:hypothetical protein
MNCDECEGLRTEAAACWQAYLSEKHLNRARGKSPADMDTKKQDNLLGVYRLAAARQRVHRGKVHPEGGGAVRIEDLQLIAESEPQP